MKHTKIGLVGLGTVGTGVARILLENRARISRACGQDVQLARIADVDITRERNLNLPEGILTTNYEEILNDPEISVVVQLIGGLDVERKIMLQMLEAGKNIVTANKALIATCGKEIFDTARKCKCSVAFEAAVGGGIPIIAAISESLAANEICSIEAILNGTCNFILSSMEKTGGDYSTTLSQAQKLGYAEANPAMDVEGKDATQKICILSQIAFGADLDWTHVSRQGVESVRGEDFQYAKSQGYTIRLIASAKRVLENSLEVCVGPCWVRQGTQLAEVDGAFNGVSVVGDAVGHLFFYGQGAGEMPTASAVVADIIDTICGRTAITFNTLNLWNDETCGKISFASPDNIKGEFYLRLVPKNAESQEEIIRILEENEVLVAVTLPNLAGGTVPENPAFAILTNETSEGTLCSVLNSLEQKNLLQQKPVKMRVLR
ncbi:MAG: homoserine dehydrogenase [Planctomycetia bacterium]|nr:homoserine dehydrogenase [Planctomycetia bacterium]